MTEILVDCLLSHLVHIVDEPHTSSPHKMGHRLGMKPEFDSVYLTNPINLVLHQFGGRCTVAVKPILCWLNHSGIQLPGTEVLDSICGVYGTIWS